jgi:hypothetical protein
MAGYRRIATEEAFAIPEQFEAWRELLKSSDSYDPDLFLARAQTDGGQLSHRLLDLDEERLNIMDEAGIAMHLLSLTSTGVQALDSERAVSLARLANDRLAAAIARHPDRYAGLATIAPQDPASTRTPTASIWTRRSTGRSSRRPRHSRRRSTFIRARRRPRWRSPTASTTSNMRSGVTRWKRACTGCASS